MTLMSAYMDCVGLQRVNDGTYCPALFRATTFKSGSEVVMAWMFFAWIGPGSISFDEARGQGAMAAVERGLKFKGWLCDGDPVK